MILAPDKFGSGFNILFDMAIDHPCFLSSVDICHTKDTEFFLQLFQLYQRSIETQPTWFLLLSFLKPQN